MRHCVFGIQWSIELDSCWLVKKELARACSLVSVDPSLIALSTFNALQLVLLPESPARKRKYDSISNDLVDLHWLPVKERIDFKILVIVYKSLHHQAPDYLADLLQVRTTRRRLRSTSSTSSTLIEHRTHHSTFADRSFYSSTKHDEAMHIWDTVIYRTRLMVVGQVVWLLYYRFNVFDIDLHCC